MNKYDREEIAKLRDTTKKQGMNRYRFAWYLMERYPNLVIAIIREYLGEQEATHAERTD